MAQFEKFSKLEKNVFSTLFGQDASDDDGENGCEESQIKKESSECTEQKIIVKSKHSGEVTIEIIQRKSLGIAFQMWPASTHLVDYILENLGTMMKGDFDKELNIIELGCGLGVSGLLIAKVLELHSSDLKLGKVVLTDLEPVMSILNENIELNALGEKVVAFPLDWFQKESVHELFDLFFRDVSKPPLVIAADVVYFESLFQPLSEVFELLCSRGCTIIVSHVKRWKRDAKFFQLCKKKNLEVVILSESVEHLPHEHTGELTRQISRIYQITKLD
jgi:hypothetical protein